MTKDEALRLALRAMVVNNYAWKYLAESGDVGNFEAEEQGYYQLNEKAITAVEAALEAKDEPVVWNEGVPAMLPKQKEGETFIVSYEPKLEAKVEPVAWMDASRFEELRNGFTVMTTLTKKKAFFDDIAIYATPPQRTWVGLTDEHKEGLIYMTDPNPEPHHLRELIDVVEFQLKEKNNG